MSMRSGFPDLEHGPVHTGAVLQTRKLRGSSKDGGALLPSLAQRRQAV